MPEIYVILITWIVSFLAAWFGANILIIRKVKALLTLAKNLSAGDLSARSGLSNNFGLLGELAQAIDQMVDTVEERDRKIHQRTDEFTALVELMNELALQQNPSDLLQVMAEKAKLLLNVSNVTILLYDSDLNEFIVTVVKGIQVPMGLRIPMEGRDIDFAARIHQPFIVNNYQTWEERFPEFETIPISALMHVPMIHQLELIGLLVVAEIEPSPRKYNQEDVQLLSLFAGHAASVLKIVTLFEKTRRHLRELEAINEVSVTGRIARGIDEMMMVVLEKTLDIVDANMGSIWLYNTVNNTLCPVVSIGILDPVIILRPGEGIIGTVFSTGKPYLTTNIKEDQLTHSSSRSNIPAGISGAFIPIRTTQDVVGVIAIGFNAPKSLSEQQIQFISTVTENAGHAIHRNQLYEKMTHQLQRLDALHQIDLSITSSLDLGKTLEVLLDQIINQLGVDAVCVLVFNPYEQTLDFAASRGFNTDKQPNTRLKLGESYAGRAAAEQKRIHIPDLRSPNIDFLRSPSFITEGFVEYYAIPLVTRNQVKGVLEVFHRSPFECDHEWLDFLETISSQAAIAIDVAALFLDLQRSNTELNMAYNSTLEGWSRALDLRDKETEGHSQRVTELTLRMAKAMSIDEADLIHIRRGALLHDIGKLGVPDDILLKNGPLNEVEMEKIRLHPTIAYELLVPIAYLAPSLDIPYCHHEKWDGSGYPRGLKGEEIPLVARIFAIVDVWDALTSDRPYRQAWPQEKALDYIREQSGHHFDPKIVEIFISMMGEGSKANIIHPSQQLQSGLTNS